MLAHALFNELFNVFPILFHVKVCVGTTSNHRLRTVGRQLPGAKGHPPLCTNLRPRFSCNT